MTDIASVVVSARTYGELTRKARRYDQLRYWGADRDVKLLAAAIQLRVWEIDEGLDVGAEQVALAADRVARLMPFGRCPCCQREVSG